MSIQDLFVYIIVAGCVLWAGRRFLRQVIRRKEHAGGCGCSRAVCYSLDSYEFFVGPQWSDFGGRIGRRGLATKVGRSLEISFPS